MNLNARSILLWGEHSTACGYLAPPYSIVVISSLGAAFSTAATKTSIGFLFVLFSMIPKAFSTILYTCMLLPLQCPELILCVLPLWPGIIILFINLSTIEYLFL